MSVDLRAIFQHLTVDTMSGTVCIQKTFDFEKQKSYQTTVIATNASKYIYINGKNTILSNPKIVMETRHFSRKL